MQLEIDRISPSKCIVTITGRLDRTTAPDADSKLAPVLADPPRHLVIDLSGLEFISSAGLRTILGARRRLAEVGGECLVVGMSPGVVQVFDAIASLAALRAFKSMEELDSYLASLQGGSGA